MSDEPINFTQRFRVETNMQGKVIDHREGFANSQYFRDQEQLELNRKKREGMHPMEMTPSASMKPPKATIVEGRLSDNRKALKVRPVRSPQPEDEALKAAIEKDLRSRNITTNNATEST